MTDEWDEHNIKLKVQGTRSFKMDNDSQHILDN